jgi:hypothetical protein
MRASAASNTPSSTVLKEAVDKGNLKAVAADYALDAGKVTLLDATHRD